MNLAGVSADQRRVLSIAFSTSWEPSGRRNPGCASSSATFSRPGSMIVEGSVLTFDILEPVNDAPSGPEPNGPASSLPEGRGAKCTDWGFWASVWIH